MPAQSAYHAKAARAYAGQGAQSQEGGQYYGGGEGGLNTDRERLMEAEVYKEGYNKLKEKYKREA